MKTEIEIKEELTEILTSTEIDYDKVMSLSNALIKFDQDHVRFSVDAGLINRLGNELVARQETAVSELVKNSYDADATEVNLTFIDSKSIGGTLKINDNGVGMTRKQLINGFMRISSTDKISNPISILYKRKRAGQKGIGRFAVQRLGKKLTVITQTKDSDIALKLSINWDDYTKHSDLISISHSVESIPKQQVTGTTLEIELLRDRWSEASIKRVYRYVSDIIQPFPISKIKNIDKENTIDPGFKSIFYMTTENRKIKVGDEQLMIYDYATAEIDGFINNDGYGEYLIRSKNQEFNFEDKIGLYPEDKMSKFDKIKNIRFRAYYYIYDGKTIPKMHESAIRNLAKKSGGIRLYRNGFRVLPYGEFSDDWLSLNASTAKRSILPVHANINFFGFVEIKDSCGDFQETSSREGLMENESLIQLKNFIYRTIMTAVIRIAEIRAIKSVSGQHKDEKGYWEKVEITVKDIAHTLDELDKALEDGENSIIKKKKGKKKVKSLRRQFDEINKLYKQEQSKMLNERSMLRVLSNVGLSIGQFVHEIKYHLDNIKDDIKFLLNNIEKNNDALNRLNILDKNFEIFGTYISYFHTIVSQNIIRDLKPLELRTIIRPFVELTNNDAVKSDIQILEPIFHTYNLFTCPTHPSEWSSILFNLYTNSKKAIKRTNNKGCIFIEAGKEDDIVYIEFSDNGDGISKENEEHVFEEFFTTTSQPSLKNLNDSNEILGTGLGLKIVKDIVNNYKGNIKVVSPKGDFSTCIRIEIPKATEKQIREYEI